MAKPSPQRTALADAIAAHAEAGNTLAAAIDAEDAALRAVWRAQGERDDAKQGLADVLTKWNRRPRTWHVESEMGEEIGAAEAAVVAAKPTVAPAEAAAKAATAERSRAEWQHANAQAALKEAARAVVRAEAEPLAVALLEDLTKAQAAVAKAGFFLDWLANAGLLTDPTVKVAVNTLYANPAGWPQFEAHRHANPWPAVLAGLERDATVPLPA